MKAAARSARLTSAALGTVLGVEDGAVRNWWRGHSEPTLDMLRQYADAVGVSAAYLLHGEEERSSAAPLEKSEVVRVLDALIAAFAAQPAGLTAPTPDVSAAVTRHPEAERLAASVEVILDSVRHRFGREWSDLTEEERREVLASIADTLLGQQRLEAPQPDS
jgi:transcriptional regulator with XRE-family HTH domain